MSEFRARIVAAILGVAAILIGATLAYQVLVFVVADTAIGFVQALQIVVEALTTAGFGGDTDLWRAHDALAAFIVLLNLTGVGLVFLALPLFVVPLFREVFQDDPATETDLEDHVILCSYADREKVMLEELEAAEVPYVIVSEDRETALELEAKGVTAMTGDFEEKATYQAGNLADARGVVVDIATQRNVSAILTIRELDGDVPIVSVVDSETDEQYHHYAGADAVVRPRKILGEHLGTRLVEPMCEELRDTIELDDDLELHELRIEEGCELSGLTFGEAALRERFGTTVVGVWKNGAFDPAPGPETVIDDRTLLLVAGDHEALTEIHSLAITHDRGAVSRAAVFGYGVVGREVVDQLETAGIETTVVDREPADHVDVIGDVSDPELFDRLDLEDYDAVVLALDDDTLTMYTAVAIESIAPSVEVLARCNDTENLEKLYSAGADYVLSLSAVMGRMLAAELLEEELLTARSRFEIIRTPAPRLAGKTIREAAIREQTDVTVLAIERDDDFLVTPEPEVRIDSGDELLVVGSDRAVNDFIDIAK
ncbi:MAG: potassium channel family protein [Halodesulfurarchaeum sp.]